MQRPQISIVNSSTFGKHFAEHISALERFADLHRLDVAADINAADLREKLLNADGIIASVTPRFPAELLSALPKLILLFRHGIGCDNVDLRSASEAGILVSRVKGIVEREAVSEHAISLLMAAARFLPQGHHAVTQSKWSARAGFIGLELKGKTVGIIGLGNIGSRSCEILSKGFNAKVLAVDPNVSQDAALKLGAELATLDEIIKQASVILFHCPLTEKTKRMFGKPQFAAMKKGSILVNTCRGELVDENALIDALQNGQLGAYATDVVEGEPIDGNHRLAKLSNVIITPHLGGYTTESLHGMGQTGVDDMIAVFTQGKLPGELANPEVLNKPYRTWPQAKDH